MIALIRFLLAILTSPFKSKSRLEAENAALRQQLVLLQRKVKSRVALSNGDRLFFVQLYQWFPSILEIITIIQPETLVRWHRTGFRRYWRWKSLSLSRIESEHIDDAILRELALSEWLRLIARRVISVRPCTRQGAFERNCSIPSKKAEGGVDAARQRQRRDQGIRVGLSRSGVRSIHSAKASVGR